MTFRSLRGYAFGLLALLLTDLTLAQGSDKKRASDSREAATIAKRQQPGKVLSVRREGNHFKVKILHQGKVNYIVVKAR